MFFSVVLGDLKCQRGAGGCGQWEAIFFLTQRIKEIRFGCADDIMSINTLPIRPFPVFLLDVTDCKHASVSLEDLHID